MTITCPYCRTKMRFESERKMYRASGDSVGYEVTQDLCPECGKLIIAVSCGEYRLVDGEGELRNAHFEVVYPGFVPRLVDERVPERYRAIHNEANSVLRLSPKSSAALSRRLLQTVFHEEFGIKCGDLAKEIAEFLKLPNVPSDVSGSVDAIRQVGNFAAHPIKYQNTGEIVDVESDEAEWLLEALEALFDFRFVQPAIQKERTDKLNQKLQALNKPLLKS